MRETERETAFTAVVTLTCATCFGVGISHHQLHGAHIQCSNAGAIGAAILSCQGASLPEERQERDNRKPQRGGRRSSAPVKRQTEAAQSFPPFALLRWCQSLLGGSECSYTGTVLTPAEQELILQCLGAFLRHCGSDLLPRASMHVVRTILKLLDSAKTQASYVNGLLELLNQGLSGSIPQEIAQMVPDILDVLLGWAVDPTTQHSTRYEPVHSMNSQVCSVVDALNDCLSDRVVCSLHIA